MNREIYIMLSAICVALSYHSFANSENVGGVWLLLCSLLNIFNYWMRGKLGK